VLSVLLDQDGDGYAWTGHEVPLCSRGKVRGHPGRDCDDGDDAVHPGPGGLQWQGRRLRRHTDPRARRVPDIFLDADGDGYGIQRVRVPLRPGGGYIAQAGTATMATRRSSRRG